MASRTASLLWVPLLLLGCTTPPPKAWLRYEAQDLKGWQAEGDGRLGTVMLGARVGIDLYKRDTRIEVTVENGTPGDLKVMVGPEALQTPTAAIGDLGRRPLGQSRGEDVPQMVPYVSMQPAEIRTGWRGTFYLDSPLGRDPTIGQQVQLVLEVRDAKGGFERRLLSLVATNAGTLGNARR